MAPSAGGEEKNSPKDTKKIWEGKEEKQNIVKAAKKEENMEKKGVNTAGIRQPKWGDEQSLLVI